MSNKFKGKCKSPNGEWFCYAPMGQMEKSWNYS